ncbi:CO dehydrogenase/acetyl-CoA synthase complex subunit epsilon [Methanocella arvoryzae]|uniref:Carbon monoxide dehydrogenase/acetyl-CoA synthase complex, epsilon subunit n=1 Tax=Methanocella arvoryzae (strain DSM 22066 / NBRC 105507 / MRE50) TaxID=351160 RepID=Q0W882_METAR|nr:CO dehydrogenase/acetyl-CoA synthase complex subunit epsilon [Methanocella arvoryzae]CAJ35411.1 carbon monoxide dehydrogenase/acetyl-CoA synthase complex, epsilon subunit [Methanocella arvoryzae MRE50]
MAILEPWQIAEISGPRKAAAISKPEVVVAMIKRSKRPVMIIGHLAAEIAAGDRKLLDYLIDLGNTKNIPIIATGHTNRNLVSRGYTKATILPAVEAAHRLADSGWQGLDGKGPHDLAFFAGLPYYLEWTILSGLKHFAPHVRTVSLGNGYQPHAGYSFASIPTEQWLESLKAVIGQMEG